MRFKRAYIVFGLALAATVAFASVSWATHTPQPASVTFTKTGKETSKGAPGTLAIDLGPDVDDPATPDPVPPKPTNVDVDLSKGLTFGGSQFPTCSAASLEGVPPTGPGSAQSLCGNEAPKSKNALIATGTAKAQVGPNVLDATALAFNGGANSVIIYARVDALSLTTILNCTLSPAPDQSKFKSRFACPVPPLAGGAGALTEFHLKFDRVEKKVKKKHGKKKKKIYSIITGKCPEDGQYQNQVTFTYSDHEPETAVSNQPC